MNELRRTFIEFASAAARVARPVKYAAVTEAAAQENEIREASSIGNRVAGAPTATNVVGPAEALETLFLVTVF